MSVRTSAASVSESTIPAITKNHLLKPAIMIIHYHHLPYLYLNYFISRYHSFTFRRAVAVLSFFVHQWSFSFANQIILKIGRHIFKPRFKTMQPGGHFPIFRPKKSILLSQYVLNIEKAVIHL